MDGDHLILEEDPDEAMEYIHVYGVVEHWGIRWKRVYRKMDPQPDGGLLPGTVYVRSR